MERSSMNIEKIEDIRSEDLYEQPFYFENISMEGANDVLETIKKEGAFLIRRRMTGDTLNQPYAISFYSNAKVHHSRIFRDKNGRFSLKNNNEQQKSKTFSSILDIIKFLDQNSSIKYQISTKYNNLIDWYRSNNKLANLNEKQAPNEDYLEHLPYILKNKSRVDIERILYQIRENQVFFIRISHKATLCSYELSIFLLDNVYHLKINKDSYHEYSIEGNDMSFESLPEMVKYYNYQEFNINSALSSKLNIYSKYMK